jgi:spermidine synthase
MFPATFCAGMTLPLITKTLVRAGAGERAVGQVYGVNTLGSIAGAALAGLVLLPLLGLKVLLLAGALVDMGLGVLLFAVRSARSAPARQFAFGSAAATAVLLTGVAATTHFDRAVLTSGVYRYGTVARGAESEVRFYKDGRTATVSVRRSGSLVTLATNGKPDASLDRAWYGRGDGPPATLTKDASTQALLPLFALAHAPRARTAAVIGQGSGMTTHFLLASAALRDVTTIEIEPEMVRGSRLFYPANRRAFDDPRSHYVIDDAKSYFAAANRRFDVIVSEPSNPWVSGVSGLFTDEFYARVTRYLAPDGVFGQWLHLYEIDDALVLGVISALSRHFRSYAIYYCSAADVFIVASTRDSLPAPDWSVAALPGVREDLRRFVPLTAQGLDAMRLIGGAGLAPLLAVRAAPNSDFYPFLDLGAERARFMQSEAEGFRYLSAGRFDVAAALEGRRVNFGTERLAPTPEIARVNALALGARLRAARSAPPGAPAGDSATEGALYRLRALEDAMASGRAPSSWRLWARQAADVEGELHGGTAGVADEAFYAELARYMARAGAPAEAREAIDFLHAAARWDWPAAARLADRLVPRVAAGAEWLPPELVHDAAVVAKIEVGDAPGAERVAAALAPVLHRSRADLRSLLIASYVRKVRPSR